MKFLKIYFILTMAVALLSGCATQRINQFKNFANAGKAYSEAMVVLTKEAGHAAIDADSAILMLSRKNWDSNEREDNILENTEELKKLLSVMSDLRKHTLLLKKYFTALSKLAESDAPSGIGEEATNLVAELGKISPKIKDARIGEANVSDFIKIAVPLFVAHFQQKALEDELNRNGKVIEEELELQKAVLTIMADELKGDFEVILNQKELIEVDKPFINDKPLPKDWKKNRREVLSAYVSMASVENATKAAKELKKAFIALVENKMEPEDFENLFADISAMINLIELVQKNKEE